MAVWAVEEAEWDIPEAGIREAVVILAAGILAAAIHKDAVAEVVQAVCR